MVLDAGGRAIRMRDDPPEGPPDATAGGAALRPFNLPDGKVLCCRIGGMEGGGWTFYPDQGIGIALGVLECSVIYYTVPLKGISGYRVFRAEQFKALGVGYQLMVVDAPEWWEKREEAPCTSAPGETPRGR